MSVRSQVKVSFSYSTSDNNYVFFSTPFNIVSVFIRNKKHFFVGVLQVPVSLLVHCDWFYVRDTG